MLIKSVTHSLRALTPASATSLNASPTAVISSGNFVPNPRITAVINANMTSIPASTTSSILLATPYKKLAITSSAVSTTSPI